MRRRPNARTTLLGALLVAFVAACTSGAPASAPGSVATAEAPGFSGTTSPPTPTIVPSPPATPTPTAVGRLTERASVGCAIAKAFGGPAGANPLPELASCSDPVQAFTPIPEGGLVTTDANGEAVIDTDRCGRIFLFQSSSLKTSPCRADTPASGQFCLLENSAAWQNECSGVVQIVTPTGAVTLQGTWLSVTYDPDRQVTLVCVFEGKAIATPFTSLDGDRAGNRAIVEEGSFWFTSPDDRMDEVGGLEPRNTYDFERLPAVMEELGLNSWFAAIANRARADGVDTHSFPRTPTINIRGGGAELERVDAQNAVINSTDWATEWSRLFPDGDVAITALMGSDPPKDLRFWASDVELAFSLLKTSGAGGMAPVILVEADDRIIELGKILLASLSDLRLKVADFLISDSPDEAARTFDTLIARGRAVIWLSTR